MRQAARAAEWLGGTANCLGSIESSLDTLYG